MYLDFLLQLALEATPNHFTLTRLQAVSDGRNRTNVIGHGEQNQFPVYKVRVWYFVDIMVKVSSGLPCNVSHSDLKRRRNYVTRTYSELPQPFLSVVSLLLAESQFNEFPVPILSCRKRYDVFPHVAEVISSIAVFARSQALLKRLGPLPVGVDFVTDLVVLGIPFVRIGGVLLPSLKFR